ncbi:MAG: hypothetical protein KF878_09885 [Planctomycetes bacterium]|nr:hypothetical protein [Planctomycetota bacterium]
MTATNGDKITHVLTRLDALTGELASVRDEVAELQRARDQHGADLLALRGDVSALKDGLAEVRVEVSGLRGLMDAQSSVLAMLSGKVGKGALAGAGVPSVVVILMEVARALGWLPGWAH